MPSWKQALRGGVGFPLLFVSLSLACSRTAPLSTPDTISFSALPPKTVEGAIQEGASKRGWHARVVQPGLIEANLRVRGHFAEVRIFYGPTSIDFAYEDSANLDYTSGPHGERIHVNYNSWVQNLATDVEVALRRVR